MRLGAFYRNHLQTVCFEEYLSGVSAPVTARDFDLQNLQQVRREMSSLASSSFFEGSGSIYRSIVNVRRRNLRNIETPTLSTTPELVSVTPELIVESQN